MQKELKKRKGIMTIITDKLSVMSMIFLYILIFLLFIIFISGLFGLFYEVILIGLFFDHEFLVFAFIESIFVIWLSSYLLWLAFVEIRSRKK